MMSPLQLYSIFHLNLCYSSIEENQRPEVIRRCYWPLLRLAEIPGVPIGIEASGYTLETIAKLAPDWIRKLGELLTDNRCQFIGSGYAQLIGPLVPSEVNRWNLELGHRIYEKLLGFRPGIALVNEQAYSAGLVGLYQEAGYQATVMEWDNPGSGKAGWSPEARYLPQIAVGQHGEEMPLLWNNAIAFQKFQRCAHGELEPDEYIDYLAGQAGPATRAFSLYGNDAEIFDYRPGRFHTETALDGTVSEWERIASLYRSLQQDQRFSLILPEKSLELLGQPGAGHRLRLESVQQPIPVKKQAKYNITRWAVTGRDDLAINSACYRIHDVLRRRGETSPEPWKELCYLWSSDFRTHITEKRWQRYIERLRQMEEALGSASSLLPLKPAEATNRSGFRPAASSPFKLQEKGNLLRIDAERLTLVLNKRRGLAVDSLVFPALSEKPLLGTLAHGYFDDIAYGADFYTGHMVFLIPGQHQVTDLEAVKPELYATGSILTASATVTTRLGPIYKEVRLDSEKGSVEFHYHLDWPHLPLGALRLGHLTLRPESFDPSTLFCQTHNGGVQPETFLFSGEKVNHLAPASSLVSASQGLAASEGSIVIGDRQKRLCVTIDKCAAALTAHLFHTPVGPSFLCRLVFSASEIDDTSKPANRQPGALSAIRLALRAEAG